MHKRLVNLKKLIDPWSVPHFMFGIVMALAAAAFAWPAMQAFFGIIILAILWELLEMRFRLSEAPGNAWMDVLLPLIAFTATYPLVSDPAISNERRLPLLVIALILYGMTNYLSWRARFERDRDFQG